MARLLGSATWLAANIKAPGKSTTSYGEERYRPCSLLRQRALLETVMSHKAWQNAHAMYENDACPKRLASTLSQWMKALL